MCDNTNKPDGGSSPTFNYCIDLNQEEAQTALPDTHLLTHWHCVLDQFNPDMRWKWEINLLGLN